MNSALFPIRLILLVTGVALLNVLVVAEVIWSAADTVLSGAGQVFGRCVRERGNFPDPTDNGDSIFSQLVATHQRRVSDLAEWCFNR